MEKDFSGKVVLVTGASSGIGKSAAILFARRGAHVGIAARRVAELEIAVQEIREFGGSVEAFVADMSRADDVEAMVSNVVHRFGRLDMAFNNAGIMGKWSHISEQSSMDFEEAIGTNLRGTWLCCKHEIAQMARQGSGGAIVNTSSWLADGALLGSTLYSMSKAGMDGMTSALALETGPLGIRINNVRPGIIDTDMLRQNSNEASLKPFVVHTPMARVGTPEEVAELAVWLCSDASRFISGQSILIDGGYAIPGHRV